MFDLRNVRVRSGEEHREAVEVAIAPVELGGQRYVAVPEAVPAELAITRASTGWVFQLRLAVRLHGPCVRCLGGPTAVPHLRGLVHHPRPALHEVLMLAPELGTDLLDRPRLLLV